MVALNITKGPAMKKRVISFNYTLKDPNGQILDSSNEGPLSFLEGQQQIIPALESELISMLIGQKKNVKITAANAYGEYDENQVIDVPRAELSHIELEVGGLVQVQSPSGIQVLKIVEMDDSNVTMDANHPLAGVDLEFDVELVDSREATAEELSHGHAHGPGGHQH
jgi:FKBP-type peptidyl-prolyl cis-trans isomerase SlyD